MTNEQAKTLSQPGPIEEILAPVLGEAGARKRLAAALEADARSADQLASQYVELDALIDAVIARLDAAARIVEAPPLPADVLAPGGPGGAPAVEPDVEMAPPEIPIDSPIDVTPSQPIPPLPQVQSVEELPLIPPADADTAAVNLLYEDIIWLVSIDDWGGALVSLERLLVMARLDGHVREFVEVNEVKLLNLYESYLGPFTKTPTLTSRTLDNAMPGAYARAEKLARVIELIDGKRDMNSLFKESPYSPLETCSAISQLRRSGMLVV